VRDGTENQRICAIKHCQRPTPNLAICHSCIDTAAEDLEKISDTELERLYAIAYGVEKSAERTARNQTGDNETPPDVLTLGVWELANNIAHEWPAKLPYLAKNPDAKSVYWQIVNGCETAQTMINGEPMTYTDGDVKKVNETLATPMPIETLLDWLWDTFRIRLTRKHIYNWTQRGRIRAWRLPGQNYKIYRPKDVLENL
jgi:hypothetical protein